MGRNSHVNRLASNRAFNKNGPRVFSQGRSVARQGVNDCSPLFMRMLVSGLGVLVSLFAVLLGFRSVRLAFLMLFLIVMMSCLMVMVRCCLVLRGCLVMMLA